MFIKHVVIHCPIVIFSLIELLLHYKKLGQKGQNFREFIFIDVTVPIVIDMFVCKANLFTNLCTLTHWQTFHLINKPSKDLPK